MRLTTAFTSAFIAITAIAAVPAHAQDEGDAVAGKKVFNKCKSCHDAKKEKNRVGPHLVGIIDRPAGSLESFKKYSKPMKELGAGGMIWDVETLAKYLRKPKDVVPKGSMSFSGLKKDAQIADVIAYLAADPKP